MILKENFIAEIEKISKEKVHFLYNKSITIDLEIPGVMQADIHGLDIHGHKWTIPFIMSRRESVIKIQDIGEVSQENIYKCLWNQAVNIIQEFKK